MSPGWDSSKLLKKGRIFGRRVCSREAAVIARASMLILPLLGLCMSASLAPCDDSASRWPSAAKASF